MSKAERVGLIKAITTTLKWIEDKESGELIEAPNYTKDFLGFTLISQKDLDSACRIVNEILEKTACSYSIYNSMGEIRATRKLRPIKQYVCNHCKGVLKETRSIPSEIRVLTCEYCNLYTSFIGRL